MKKYLSLNIIYKMINPFDYPDQVMNIDDFLGTGQENTENLFKEFFRKQVSEDIIDGKISNSLKIYKINRCHPDSNVEIIQAYNNSQAAYLFLLYETQSPECYPFTDRLQHCRDLGPLTPYDVYLLVVHTILDKDIEHNDYLTEINQLIILCP
jgi:hypothetical protein